MDMILRKIIEGVANTRGDAFFQAITLQLNQVIKADFTFIARLNRLSYTSRTIALVVDGKLAENMEYSLQHTPCANAADDSYCIYPSGIQQTFPQDQLLIDLGVEAYVGTPLHDLHGGVMGIVVAMYRSAITQPENITTLFSIFSGRIEAEMERQDYEQQLQEFNRLLEHKVQQRTIELQKALTDVQQMQQQLIESEKQAALGHFVAGMAHEVNTPLGVAVTTHSMVEQEFKQLHQQLNQDRLTKSTMQRYCHTMLQALPLLGDNLQRASDIIQHVKHTSATQHASERDTINIRQYYQQVISTLPAVTNAAEIEVSLNADDNWTVSTIPASHLHIISTLISNSVQHGFHGTGVHHINITISHENKGYQVEYRDNGRGLSAESQKRLFEPFYTTARAQGAIGLGMSVLYNLVTAQLGGAVHLPAVSEGFALTYTFKDLPVADATK